MHLNIKHLVNLIHPQLFTLGSSPFFWWLVKKKEKKTWIFSQGLEEKQKIHKMYEYTMTWDRRWMFEEINWLILQFVGLINEKAWHKTTHECGFWNQSYWVMLMGRSPGGRIRCWKFAIYIKHKVYTKWWMTKEWMTSLHSHSKTLSYINIIWENFQTGQQWVKRQQFFYPMIFFRKTSSCFFTK